MVTISAKIYSWRKYVFWIRIRWIRIGIQTQVFQDQNLIFKNLSVEKLKIFGLKNVGRRTSELRKLPSSSRHKNTFLFLFFGYHFGLPGSGADCESGDTNRIESPSYQDRDPKHWQKTYECFSYLWSQKEARKTEVISWTVCITVLRIRHILVWFGSESAPLTNWSGSCYFVSDLYDGNKKLFKFFAYYFLKLHLHNFSKIKSQPDFTKQ
jgi:hypothetical protein